eukprot:8481117-Pyramimonas_sp.AAC.1
MWLNLAYNTSAVSAIILLRAGDLAELLARSRVLGKETESFWKHFSENNSSYGAHIKTQRPS